MTDKEIKKFLSQLKNYLSDYQNLPGTEAHQLMMPDFRIPENFKFSKQSPRPSGVMVLLYPVDDFLYTVFIKRSRNGSVHSGQISLPGGGSEKQDNSLFDTACRETQEEIACSANTINKIGQLSDLFVPVSNFMITPFVGYVNHRPEFIPNPDEVEEIIEVNIDKLFHQDSKIIKEIFIHNQKIKAPAFQVRKYHIWGATAMILSEFNKALDAIDTPFISS